MCHFRKRATSVPAEGPAYGLDFARHCEFLLRALACSRKWHVWCRLNETTKMAKMPPEALPAGGGHDISKV